MRPVGVDAAEARGRREVRETQVGAGGRARVARDVLEVEYGTLDEGEGMCEVGRAAEEDALGLQGVGRVRSGGRVDVWVCVFAVLADLWAGMGCVAFAAFALFLLFGGRGRIWGWICVNGCTMPGLPLCATFLDDMRKVFSCRGEFLAKRMNDPARAIKLESVRVL